MAILRDLVGGNPAIAIFIATMIVAVVGLLAITAVSLYQNGTKEKWRCRECGFLANSQGTEEALVFPQFRKSTYHIHEETGRQWHETETVYEEDDYDNSNRRTRERSVLYAEYHISETCKKCGNIRREYTVKRRRSPS